MAPHLGDRTSCLDRLHLFYPHPKTPLPSCCHQNPLLTELYLFSVLRSLPFQVPKLVLLSHFESLEWSGPGNSGKGFCDFRFRILKSEWAIARHPLSHHQCAHRWAGSQARELPRVGAGRRHWVCVRGGGGGAV